MDEIVLLDATERFLNGEMTDQERVFFEELRRTNPEVDQFVVEHSVFLHQLQDFSTRKSLQSILHDTHQTLLSEGSIKHKPARRGAKVIALWNKYKKVAVVAASIAGITALSITFLVVSLTRRTAGGSEVTELVGAINDVKKSVARQYDELDNKIEKVSASSIPTTPARFGGSAFLVDGKGYLVTCNHVLQKDSRISVQNTKGRDFYATVVYKNEKTDVAILKIDDKDFRALAPPPFSIRRNMADLGEEVYTLGFPRADMVYGAGYLSAKSGYNGDTTTYQVAITANPGNSGGPLVNNAGEVIGLLSSKENNKEGFVFATKSKNILNAFTELKKDTAYRAVRLPASSTINGMRRVQQIRQMEDYIFRVKVY
jgi:serine protease Do